MNQPIINMELIGLRRITKEIRHLVAAADLESKVFWLKLETRISAIEQELQTGQSAETQTQLHRLFQAVERFHERLLSDWSVSMATRVWR